MDWDKVENGEIVTMDSDKLMVVFPQPTLTIERLDPSLPMPKYAKEGDAGFDLYAWSDFFVPPRTIFKMPLRIRAEIPEGYEIQIRPRSSVAEKGVMIANSPGTVDQGYRGEWALLMWTIHATGKAPEFSKGDRIAQAVLAPVTRANIVEGVVSTDTERGEDGFGSTGV